MWKNEMTILNDLSDVDSVINILHAYVVTKERRSPVYVIELEHADGDLQHLLHGKTLNARLMMKRIITMYVELSRMNVAHRDIKPENILFFTDEDGHITKLKIADFGTGCYVDTANFKRRTGRVGTVTYMCPNKHAGCSYDVLKSEVWSVGIILYNLLTNDSPYWITNNGCLDEDYGLIVSREWDKYWKKKNLQSHMPTTLKHLFYKLLEPDENDRISMDHILNHPWFGEENKENLKVVNK